MTDEQTPKAERLENLAPNAEASQELTEQEAEAAQGGQTFLTYKFGTVFTTKIDWSGPGDEGPKTD
jgi:hypothetical protein